MDLHANLSGYPSLTLTSSLLSLLFPQMASLPILIYLMAIISSVEAAVVSGNGKPWTKAEIGGTLGAVAGAAILISLAYWLIDRRSKRMGKDAEENDDAVDRQLDQSNYVSVPDSDLGNIHDKRQMI